MENRYGFSRSLILLQKTLELKVLIKGQLITFKNIFVLMWKKEIILLQIVFVSYNFLDRIDSILNILMVEGILALPVNPPPILNLFGPS